MAPFLGAPSPHQQVALALAPKFMAVLSIAGSSYILWDILVRKQQRQSSTARSEAVAQAKLQTFQRLMIGLSATDILMSTGLFTSTWPMPADTENVWGAAGTTATCAAVGFLEQSGVAAVLYNASLSVYYVGKICFGLSNHQMASRIEPWLHAVPIAIGASTMVAGIPLTLYNSGLFDCWIAPFPQGCEESWRSPDGTSTTCIRGDNASLYQWVFDLIPKWAAILLVTINMIWTYTFVRRTEEKSMRHSVRHISLSVTASTTTRGTIANRAVLSQKLATQSYYYVGALYLIYIPVIVTRLFELIAGYVHYEMLLTIAITIPLQGFWNSLVYLRPRWIQEREKQRQSREFSPPRVSHRGQFFDLVSTTLRNGAVIDDNDAVLENEEEEETTPNPAPQSPPAEESANSHMLPLSSTASRGADRITPDRSLADSEPCSVD